MIEPTWTIHQGDALDRLREMADNRVHCVVTSPPYWNLRDYGMPGQIGLEPTVEAYLERMVDVFREVRRVLRKDGTLWLNMGDGYANDGKWGGHTGGKHVKALHDSPIGRNKRYTGLTPKDLIWMPWRLALAVQADGWYLRQDIIWFKPNAMPESTTDRCTKAHEYLFLLTKSPKYHYDAEAIKEPVLGASLERQAAGVKFGGNNLCPDTRLQSGKEWVPRTNRDNFTREGSKREQAIPGQSVGTHRPERKDSDYSLVTRNKRSVWTVPTEPYKEAHFATFPQKLVEPCILAGCPTGGMVLDPFCGAGTVGLVAARLGREFIGIELNPEYVKMAEARIAGEAAQIKLALSFD